MRPIVVHFCLAAVLVLLIAAVMPAIAFAAVKYSDYRQVNDSDVFWKHNNNDGFNNVSSGGYDNSGTSWRCNPTHGWSHCHRQSPYDRALWFLPGSASFSFDEWQAYITTSGTDTDAAYFCGGSEASLNQLTVHGWTTVMTNGYYVGSGSGEGAQLQDSHGSYGWSSGQKCDWDAIRIYY